MESDSVKIDLTFSDEDPAEVAALLGEAGATSVRRVEQSGLGIVEEVVIAIMLINAVAGLISKLARLWKGGVIISRSGSTIVTQKDSNLPRGTIVIAKADGEITLNMPSENDLASQLQGLLPSRS